jgi:hypothetical protein
VPTLDELANPKYARVAIPERLLYRNSDVTLRVELAQPSTNPTPANNRLHIRVVAENYQQFPIRVVEAGLFVTLKCRVLDSGGNDVELTPAGSELLSQLYFGGARGGSSTLAQGEQWHRDICVSDFFQTKPAKTYSIRCYNMVDIKNASDQSGTYWIESNKLDVVP